MNNEQFKSKVFRNVEKIIYKIIYIYDFRKSLNR